MMEEEGLEELKLAKFKTQNLKRSFEEASSVASSVLMFTLKWRDLEDHYDNLQRGFEEKAQELVLLQKGAKITNEVLDERHGEIALKERELVSLQTQIEECGGQLEAKKKELALVEGLLGDCSLQFKSREKELDLVKKSVRDCCTEFESKKEELFMVKKSVQECEEEREGKEKGLISVKEELESLCEEAKLKKDELRSVLKLMETHQEELGSKERRLQVVQKMLDRFSIDASEKKKEIDDLQSSLKQASKEFEMRQGDFDKLKQLDEELLLKTKKLEFLEDVTCEIQEKEQHVSSLRSLIEEYNEELVSKEKEYDSINKSIANCSAELKSKRKELEPIKNSLTQLVKELNLRKEELNEVRRDVQEAKKRLMGCNKALELKMREFTVKEEQLARILESTRACSKDIQSQEHQLAAVDEFNAQTESKNKEIIVVEIAQHECLKKPELKEKQDDSLKESVGEVSTGFLMEDGELQDFVHNLESEEKQIICVKQTVEEETVELELNDTHDDSQKEVMEDHFQELDMKEGHIKDHFKELEPKEKQMATCQLAMEEGRKESEIDEMDQLLPAAAESQSTCAQLLLMMDGSNLQALLIGLLKKHDLVHKQMTSIIRTSPNPAALVLDAMQGFYPPYLKEDGEEFEINILRKSCVLLLDQLIANSLHIGPWDQERALKLAHYWKTKMSVKSQNQLEILGFLHLLAAFRLVSAFNVNEIQDLLDLVTDHNKALKLRRVLGIPKRASASRILNHIRPEQLDHTIISNARNTFSSDQVVTGSLCVYEPTLMEGDILYALRTSPDPAKFVLDVIQDRHSKYTKDQTHGGGFDDDCLKLCVFMLEHLMQISPPLQADVKKIAANFGVEWKDRFKPDAANSLEVLVFLQFVAAYGLMSYLHLDRQEGFQLLQAIAYHKQARAVCRALNFMDILSDAICDLVAKRKYVEAVKLVCAFELTDQFSPAELLGKYNEEIKLSSVDVSKKGKNAVEVQCMMMDRTITSVREIIDCIRDFNLECDASSQVLETCIMELEKEQVKLRGSAAAAAAPPTCTMHMKRPTEALECPVEPRLPNSGHASASTNQQLGWGNKRVRT